MKFKLTQKHLDEGKRGDATCCPIALMLKDAMPGINKVMVDVEAVDKTKYVPMVICDNNFVEFLNPDKICDIILKVDSGKQVKPTFIEWNDF